LRGASLGTTIAPISLILLSVLALGVNIWDYNSSTLDDWVYRNAPCIVLLLYIGIKAWIGIVSRRYPSLSMICFAIFVVMACNFATIIVRNAGNHLFANIVLILCCTYFLRWLDTYLIKLYKRVG